jgi:hypothetical protein
MIKITPKYFILPCILLILFSCPTFNSTTTNTTTNPQTIQGHAVNLSTNQNISVVFGQMNFTDNTSNRGGTAGPNTFTASYGDPVYAAGKLFLPDTGNNRVLVFGSIPSANDANADYAVGQTNLTGNSSGLSDKELNGPESVSSNGVKLSIVDFYNNRILIYNTIPSAGGAAADVVIGQADFTSNGSGRTGSKINGPESAFITSNKLLIADSVNNRVLIFNTIPTSSGASADLVLGQTDFTSGTAGTSSTTLKNPTDVWSDGTKVIVSDAGNNRILIWNSFPTANAQAADVVVGQSDFTGGSSGTAADKFARQWNFTASSARNQMIVTDLDNHRVLVFNSIPATNGAAADAVLGQADFSTRTAGCSQNSINWPCGVCFLDDKRIIILDANNNRADIFSGI